ncbi:MAG: DNA primase family protein, partial [Candidatus Methylomirabilales bacterium]
MRRAKETVGSMYLEAAAQPDQDLRAALAAHAMKCESDSRIRAMLSLAESEPGVPVEPGAFDADPWLFNCLSGTLDLRTGELRPHRREDLLTKLAPVDYDPGAKAPTWTAFLDHIMAGNREVIEYLQRAVGHALTGDVREQVLQFLHGTGANGKTTFLNAILDAVGDYGKQAAPELLTIKYGTEHPTGLADLRGCRFVASIEVEEGKRLAEVLVKQLTGGDRLKARFMRENFFEFTPTHKIFLAVNHKPVIRGTDHAIWRRIRLVPFTVTIPDAEQDKAATAPLAPFIERLAAGPQPAPQPFGPTDLLGLAEKLRGLLGPPEGGLRLEIRAAYRDGLEDGRERAGTGEGGRSWAEALSDIARALPDALRFGVQAGLIRPKTERLGAPPGGPTQGGEGGTPPMATVDPVFKEILDGLIEELGKPDGQRDIPGLAAFLETIS